MRKIISLLLMSLFCAYVTKAQQENYLPSSICPFQLSNPIPVTEQGDGYDHPILSPDGRKIIVTKKAYQGIYLIDLDDSNKTRMLSDEPKIGFNLKWSKDSEEVRYEKNIRNKDGMIICEQGVFNLPQQSFKKHFANHLKSGKKEIEVKYNIKSRMVEATDGLHTWDITQTPGIYYNFVISPDKENVLIQKNDGKMYIYSLHGKGIISCIGRGICQSWSPDGEYILYFISHSKGEETIVESDLYISNVSGSQKWKLTDTPDKIEKWPHWSPKGDIITYSEQNSGRIYISNLQKK